MAQGLFVQDFRIHPFHKWLLCGVNGSCTDLSPLVFIQGGNTGKASFIDISKFHQYHKVLIRSEDGFSIQFQNSTTEITRVNKTQRKIDFSPTPICVYPPFLFIISNGSFEHCSNDSCWMTQCWNVMQATRAMVARVPRRVLVPVDTPSTLSLFRQKKRFWCHCGHRNGDITCSSCSNCCWGCHGLDDTNKHNS